MESRLMEIEIKLALTEDLVDTLNLTVHRQQEQIDALQRQLLALARQVQAASPAAESRDLRDEIPPHY
ncbi:SlyX family protein [Zoogloea sp.]|uniref:SlyX family protein n=1 Tax=Zoogloea sp. TaxID=49181 RepID=UPI0025FF5CB7|nr:SlyX family protein [Zoogloea sp.]MCK6392995.1 SlyX family protein [Zoogloea sp.]